MGNVRDYVIIGLEAMLGGAPDDAIVDYIAHATLADDDESEIRDAIGSFLSSVKEDATDGETQEFIDGLLSARAAWLLSREQKEALSKSHAIDLQRAAERTALELDRGEQDARMVKPVLSDDEKKRREHLFSQYGVSAVETDDAALEDTFFERANAGDSAPALARNDNRATVKAEEDRKRRQMSMEHEKAKEREKELKAKQQLELEKEKKRTQKKEKRRM
ncbi:hypothetical protein DFJ74DRAFT_768526 [Hyaloraphidium curvatum]|nr:hypothetical protein DFJ74DRAFT_768526 [Hyaloraphidium curvatum]